MSDVFDAELSNRDTQMTLVGGLAALALLLASGGLYGVLFVHSGSACFRNRAENGVSAQQRRNARHTGFYV